MADSKVDSCVKYDLTHRLAECLDRHLVFPLLEFLCDEAPVKFYAKKDLLDSKLDLLSATNMVDFAMETYKVRHETKDAPASFAERREVVIGHLTTLKEGCLPILRLLDPQNSNALNQLKNEKQFTLQFLSENYEVTADSLESLYWFAKFQYECGNYEDCINYLHHYRLLSTNQERNNAALWGKLAAEILMQQWDNALEDLLRIRDAIDAHSFSAPVIQLQQRTWLIHWSLFIFFNFQGSRDAIIELLFSDKFLNAIQTNCPYILRYLTAAVITSKTRRPYVIKDLERVICLETYNYRDPITEFIECLYVKFDFDGAQQKLRDCQDVLANDFFLAGIQEDFIENARMCVFEIYCKIHQTIDIADLAGRLNMSVDDAERWIVNLIRNADMDAKIDSEAKEVIMGQQYPSVYHQVIEHTKNLSFRSMVLATNLERKVQGQPVNFKQFYDDMRAGRGADRDRRQSQGGFRGNERHGVRS